MKIPEEHMAKEWLEVSLTVSGELAEAVAEVLARFSGNSVMTEQGIRHMDDADEGVPDGPITVRAYLPADDQLPQTRRKLEEALHYLGMIQDLPRPVFRRVPDQNWMEAWRQRYRPIPIGRRLMVIPSWLESPAPDRIAIKIDPGMAFGTGTHPSTQLCLALMDRLLDPVQSRGNARAATPPSTMIDVGCGSGILSVAGIKLGVRSALGVDIDPMSVQNARENARANGIGPELELAVGSVPDILAGRYGLRSAGLVVVNILAPVIVGLFAEGLADLMDRDGSMILAGILNSQADDVELAARNAGLIRLMRQESEDWVALGMSRS